jgi:hypothetical protein
VNLHEDIPKEVNKLFANQPLDPRRGSSNPPRPLGPPRYFGLPMVNPGRPPLTPNKPYRQPLNYTKYVKDLTQMFMLKCLKLPLEQIVKQIMQKLLIYFKIMICHKKKKTMFLQSLRLVLNKL